MMPNLCCIFFFRFFKLNFVKKTSFKSFIHIFHQISSIIYIFLTSQNISWKGLKEAPAYSWLGGILGAFYVTVIVLAFPKIGPGLTYGLVVAGQLLTSMIMEHFQIMGTPHQPISIGRLAGMAMIVGGVVIMKKF